MERAATFETGSQSTISSLTPWLYDLKNWLHIKILSHLIEEYYYLSLLRGGCSNKIMYSMCHEMFNKY